MNTYVTNYGIIYITENEATILRLYDGAVKMGLSVAGRLSEKRNAAMARINKAAIATWLGD